jgi:hypothetical protein
MRPTRRGKLVRLAATWLSANATIWERLLALMLPSDTLHGRRMTIGTYDICASFVHRFGTALLTRVISSDVLDLIIVPIPTANDERPF